MKRLIFVLVTITLLFSLVPVEMVTIASAENIRGDVDGNGTVDSTDARLLLQYAVGKVDASAIDLAAADVDGSGTADSTDARWILQYAVGKIHGFPDKTRCLQVMVNGETVQLAFADEEEHVGYACYRYEGTSPSGNMVECCVIPSANAIYRINYTHVNDEAFTYGVADVHAFLRAEFQKMGMTLPGKTDIMMYTDGPFDGRDYVNVSSWFKYGYITYGECVSVTLKQADGELYISEMRTKTMEYGEIKTPFLVEYQQPCFIPNWV